MTTITLQTSKIAFIEQQNLSRNDSLIMRSDKWRPRSRLRNINIEIRHSDRIKAGDIYPQQSIEFKFQDQSTLTVFGSCAILDSTLIKLIDVDPDTAIYTPSQVIEESMK